MASLQAEQAIEAGALYVSNILANLGNQMLPSTNNYLVANVSVGQGRFWLLGGIERQPIVAPFAVAFLRLGG